MNGFPDNHPLPDLAALAVVLGGSADSFTGRLLNLAAHADPGNVYRLSRGFPREIAAWQFWRNTSPAPTAGQVRQALEQLEKI